MNKRGERLVVDMANQKKKNPNRKRTGLPAGVTYADKLAYEKRKAEAIEAAATDKMVEIRANEHTQRAMWLMVCSISDAYGFGPTRMKAFFETLQTNAEELEKMVNDVDEEYAWEKLRQKAEKVSGEKIQYLEEQMIWQWRWKQDVIVVVTEEQR